MIWHHGEFSVRQCVKVYGGDGELKVFYGKQMTEGEVEKRCVLFIDQLWKYFYFCMLAGFSLTDLMILFPNELSCMYTDW